MKSLNELIEFGEELMVTDDTPPSVKAALLRTILELRGFIGAKSTRVVTDDEDSGHERTASSIQRQIDELQGQIDAEDAGKV